MVEVVLIVCGAIAAWIVVDRLLARRAQRLSRGPGAWSSQFDGATRFHSEGFEDTLPPAVATQKTFTSAQAPRARSTS